MKQTLLQEKYPVFILELPKTETDCRTIDDIVTRIKADVAADSRIAWIGEFDHYAHTKNMGGAIAPEIVAARNLVFCFGWMLPDPKVLAARPRSIGIADCGTHFVISFLEAPMPPANIAMETWVKNLRKTGA